MKKHIPIILATMVAAAVAFVGVRSFACDKATKTANAQGTATYAVGSGAACSASGDACQSGKAAQTAGNGGSCSSKSAMAGNGGSCSSKSAMTAGAGCRSGKSANAEMTAGSSCGSHSASWASNVCGSKGYYAANVYAVREGHMYAVCQGKTFEVTATTPFTQVAEARYYFADEASKIQCHEQMKATAPAIDREAVLLATAEANVVDVEHGQKVAQCPITCQKFVVTADSPARVADGQKYYMSVEQDL